VPRDPVQDVPTSRRPGGDHPPPAPCPGPPDRERARRGRDTPGRLGLGRSAARHDRAAAHQSLYEGCRSARRSARPECPCPRPEARSSVPASSSPYLIIPPAGLLRVPVVPVPLSMAQPGGEVPAAAG